MGVAFPVLSLQSGSPWDPLEGYPFLGILHPRYPHRWPLLDFPNEIAVDARRLRLLHHPADDGSNLVETRGLLVRNTGD